MKKTFNSGYSMVFGLLKKIYSKYKCLVHWGIWCAGVVLVCIFVINLGIHVSTRSYFYDNVKDVPKTAVALIPGAAVLIDGSPSPIFRDRVDTAIELYTAGKVSKILVSGDNSTLSYNEVNPVRLYLIARGIPDEAIYLDHAGFDTYSSMYRAQYVFTVSSMTIVTQSFHLPRSVFIARALGIDAYGINADEGHILFRNYVREVFADVQAFFELVIQRKPKFLGEKIPIM